MRFEEKVDKIIIPNREEFQNQNSEKVYENINPANFYNYIIHNTEFFGDVQIEILNIEINLEAIQNSSINFNFLIVFIMMILIILKISVFS